MDIALADRLGFAGLVVALLGIAASILWPEQKWIGWVCFVAAIGLLLAWLYLETGPRISAFYSSYPVKSTLLVFFAGGILSVSVWLLIMRSSPAKTEAKPETPKSSEAKPNNDTKEPQPLSPHKEPKAKLRPSKPETAPQTIIQPASYGNLQARRMS
jgi:hypothetical protein